MKTARLTFFLCFLLVFTGFAYPTGPQLQSQVLLEKVGIELMSDRLEVTLHLTQQTNFNSFSLTGPNRLVIDLFQTGRFSFSPQIDINAFGVQKIRTAKNRPGIIRVVFDLLEQVPHHKIVEEGNSIKIEFWYEERKTERVEPKKQQAIPATKEVAEPPSSRDMCLGFGLHGGYYMFKSSKLENYFGTGRPVPGGEVSMELHIDQKSAIGLLCSFNYIKANGRGDYQGTKAKFSNNPVSLTVLFLREIGKLMPFAGIGLDYNYYQLTYPEGLPTVNNSGAVWGGNIQVGTYFLLSQKLRAKISYNYHLATDTDGTFDVVLARNEFTVSLSYWFGL